MSDSEAGRFWPKVEKTDSCWLWLGNLHREGYGRFKIRGQYVLSHRWAFVAIRGAIPTGLVLDHLCRVRRCVNPDHLEPVTIGENVMRGETVTARNAEKTSCLRGHEYTPENTLLTRDGRRRCRSCKNQRSRLRRPYGDPRDIGCPCVRASHRDAA